MTEIDLRTRFRRGEILGELGGGLAILCALGTVFLWGFFGFSGLAAAFVLYDLTVFVAAFGIQNQVDSLYMALRGVKDTSDFTARIRRGSEPEGELRGLKARVAFLQREHRELRSAV